MDPSALGPADRRRVSATFNLVRADRAPGAPPAAKAGGVPGTWRAAGGGGLVHGRVWVFPRRDRRRAGAPRRAFAARTYTIRCRAMDGAHPLASRPADWRRRARVTG